MPARLKGRWFYEFQDTFETLYRVKPRTEKRQSRWCVEAKVDGVNWTPIVEIDRDRIDKIAEGLETYARGWRFKSPVMLWEIYEGDVDIDRKRAQEMLVAYDAWVERKGI